MRKGLKQFGFFAVLAAVIIVIFFHSVSFVSAAWVAKIIDFTSGAGQYSSIAVDSNGKVHISEYSSVGLRYCNNTASNGAWSCANVSGSGSGTAGQYSSIAVDSNGKVHISEAYTTINQDLRYCNNTASSGAWSCATIDDSSGYLGSYTSIAIDSNNKVHISEYNATGNGLRYCNNTASNGAWSCALIDTRSTQSLRAYSAIALN